MRVYCEVKSTDAGWWPFKEGHDVNIGDVFTLKKIVYGSSYTVIYLNEREEPLNSIQFDFLDVDMNVIDIYNIDFMNKLIEQGLS